MRKSKPALGLVIALFLLSFDAGCAGRKKSEEPVFKGERPGEEEAALDLDPSRLTVRSVPGEERPFQHPFTVSETTLDTLLRSLYFQQKSTLTWRNPERILSNAEARVLAGRAAEAFSDLPADRLVRFRLAAKDGETSGELFVKGDCLNFRILTIQGYTFLKKGAKATAHQWKLAPQEGQGFFPSHAVLWNPKEATNWVVVKVSDLSAPGTEGKENPVDKPFMERIDVFP